MPAMGFRSSKCMASRMHPQLTSGSHSRGDGILHRWFVQIMLSAPPRATKSHVIVVKGVRVRTVDSVQQMRSFEPSWTVLASRAHAVTQLVQLLYLRMEQGVDSVIRAKTFWELLYVAVDVWPPPWQGTTRGRYVEVWHPIWPCL